MPVGGAGAVQERRCLIHDSVAVSPRRRQWRKRGRSLRSWSPTLSATAGSPGPTRRERCRGCGRLRSDLIDPAIAAHHGRVVKRTGDGILIDFRSVVDAVRCAIEVQTGMVERNADLPPERRIEFRIGVHLGDVVEEADGDLMGDGVNIAARLEGICRARRDLSLRGRLSPGEGADRSRGHRSRPDPTQEHRRPDPNLFAGSRRIAKRRARVATGTRQAPPAAPLHRRPAVRQYWRRRGAGAFRRRRHGKPDDRSLADTRRRRDRPQYGLHLQRQSRRS